MAYSFTEKKRIRKNFGKLPEILEVPSLLSIAHVLPEVPPAGGAR